MNKLLLLSAFVLTTVGLHGVDVKSTDVPVKDMFMKSDAKFAHDTAVTPADHDVNKAIRAEITGWLTNDYDEIVLATDNGVVVITGFVPNQASFDKLTTKVKEVKGVKEVKNNAQVRVAK